MKPCYVFIEIIVRNCLGTRRSYYVTNHCPAIMFLLSNSTATGFDLKTWTFSHRGNIALATKKPVSVSNQAGVSDA